MAGTFLAKRETITIYRATVLRDHGHSGPFFSTAYERSQGRNAGSIGARGEGPGPSGQGMYEAKQQSLDMDMNENSGTGAAQFMADKAKEGARKATEVADAVGDAAKKTLDGAWQTAKDANQMVRDTVTRNANENTDENGIIDNQFVDEMQNIDGPVDTVEYRNMEDNFEESKKTGDGAT